ncbi:unnamed protein product [Pleuronectes platessa]|uniref:Uncharacterized protein n=1 Tax=Pleuronectes platessa TaxID=8262 RepID=A0A9N7UYK7_PLEPL|nr:unnamed protein product [Pleuronectes platessa]
MPNEGHFNCCTKCASLVEFMPEAAENISHDPGSTSCLFSVVWKWTSGYEKTLINQRVVCVFDNIMKGTEDNFSINRHL